MVVQGFSIIFHAAKTLLKLFSQLFKIDWYTCHCSIKIGGSLRLNPCGLLVLALGTLFILYYTFGSSDHRERVSIKALLSAAIDVAKKGGQQVKMTRDQVLKQQAH